MRSPTVPPGAWHRRRWLKRLAIALVPFVLLAGWLLMPEAPLRTSLLAYMPTDMAGGVEVRRGADLWREFRDAGLPKAFFQSPLGRELDALARERGKELPARLDEAARSLDGQTKGFFRQRVLNRPVALAMADTRGKDMVILAHLDRLTRTLVRLGLWWKGAEIEPGLTGFTKAAGGRTLHFTLSGHFLVGATSPKRLQEALKALQAPPSLYATTAPKQGVVLLLRPNAMWREAMERRGAGCWLFDGGMASISMDDGEISGTARGRLRAHVVQRMEERWLASEPAARPPEEPVFPVPADSAAWCRGAAPLELPWGALCARLWGGSAPHPMRGRSHPASVMLYELLGESIIRYGDGQFGAFLGAPPVLDNDGGVPVFPAFTARFGTVQREPLFRAWNDGAEKLVAFYRAPGGNPLYQHVRDKTAIVAEGAAGHSIMRLRLHPLFFNHLAPWWTMDERSLIVTHGGNLEDEDLPPAAPTPLADAPFAWAEGGWTWSEAAFGGLRDAILDKAIAHGFAPPEARGHVEKAAALFTALGQTLPKGYVRVEAIRRRDKSEGAGPKGEPLLVYPVEAAFKLEANLAESAE